MPSGDACGRLPALDCLARGRRLKAALRASLRRHLPDTVATCLDSAPTGRQVEVVSPSGHESPIGGRVRSMDPWTPLVLGTAKVVAGLVIDDPAIAVTAWNKAQNNLFRRNARIAFTGMAGVGKTVLFDYLTGAAYDPNYSLPGPSVTPETKKEHSKKVKKIITVVPGDVSPQQVKTLSAAFDGNKTVDGVVHVVANGFAEIRGAGVTEQLVKRGIDTIDLVREEQLKNELEDLATVLSYVKKNAQAYGKPRWMVVAVTKLDLFDDDLASVESYYAADKNSPFVKQLNDTLAALGAGHFRWASYPVCSVLEDYTYNGQTKKSRLAEQQRNRLVVALDTVIEVYAQL
jgi:GTPase SAR1 family protein